MGVKEVVAAFIVRGGKVLLARRYRGDEQGGLWEFPGGGREEDEDLRECLARELSEELGIRVRVGAEVAAVRYDYGGFPIELHLLSAEILKGEPRPLGCAEVRWLSPCELGNLELAPADRELVKRLVELGKLPGVGR